jgi:hypothetical protein
MIASLSSGFSAFALVALMFVIAAAILIFYALRTKGHVSAELSHGKTTFKIDARDKLNKRR